VTFSGESLFPIRVMTGNVSVHGESIYVVVVLIVPFKADVISSSCSSPVSSAHIRTLLIGSFQIRWVTECGVAEGFRARDNI
jgi:hypothetical protein